MSESKELTVLERAQVALQPAANDLQLAELAAASKSITTITNPAGYSQCHSARMALKTMRVSIEKTGKAARDDANAFAKACIAEEKRLVALIEPEERRLEGLQSAWDLARAAEKAAREEAERKRVGEIQQRLGKIRALSEAYTSALPPDRLADVITQLEGGLTFDYQEFTQEAEAARQVALVALRQAHVEALERVEREAAERAARDAEEARKAAERRAEEDRLAEVRRRLDEEKAEQARETEKRRAEEEERRKEEARVAEIRRWIVALDGPTHLTATDSPLLIEQEIAKLREAKVDERYGEFRDAAENARAAGIGRLSSLLMAAKAHRAEQDRIAQERAELERQQRVHAERQAEIERREREQREAEERRQAEAAAEAERKEAEERARRETQQRQAAMRQRVAILTAQEIAQLAGDAIGCQAALIAGRIAEIPVEEWIEQEWIELAEPNGCEDEDEPLAEREPDSLATVGLHESDFLPSEYLTR